MKTIDEISRMTLDELEAVSQDTGIAAPEGLAEKAMAGIRRQRSARALSWTAGIAAAAALAVGIFTFVNRTPALQDTFSDPYLAYAEVEKAFSRISSAVGTSAQALDASRQHLDKSLDIVFNNTKK